MQVIEGPGGVDMRYWKYPVKPDPAVPPNVCRQLLAIADEADAYPNAFFLYVASREVEDRGDRLYNMLLPMWAVIVLDPIFDINPIEEHFKEAMALPLRWSTNDEEKDYYLFARQFHRHYELEGVILEVDFVDVFGCHRLAARDWADIHDGIVI